MMNKLIFLLLFTLVNCSVGSSPLPEAMLDSAESSYESEILPPSPAPPPSAVDMPRTMAPPAGLGEDPLPQRARAAPPAPEMDVDRILSNLSQGNVIFDSPENMIYKKSEFIEVSLYPASIRVPSPREGQLRENALLSNRMEASLVGQGFTIEILTPEIQAISGLAPTIWKWQVTPTESGSRSLHLSLLAHLSIEGRDTPFVIRTFDKNIEVIVTFPQQVNEFIRDNWKWMWGALAVPLLGFLFQRYRKRKQETT
jgi:hypothetical protein